MKQNFISRFHLSVKIDTELSSEVLGGYKDANLKSPMEGMPQDFWMDGNVPDQKFDGMGAKTFFKISVIYSASKGQNFRGAVGAGKLHYRFLLLRFNIFLDHNWSMN